MEKFIFVSGGVCSSLGKGIAASSIGALLEARGLNIRMVKCDPYINVNAGSMSPYVHGEVYVTDDGAQTDLDLGNYARFTKGHLDKNNSMTTGQVYRSVFEKEQAKYYGGRCIQVIPHITDEIKSRIIAVANKDTDVVIVEIGGTVGDIESVPFLEAARQIIHERGKTNALSVHLTLIPEIADELKTKPTQHSVKAMQEMGIQPDLLICRAPELLSDDTREKIALYTNVDPDAVFTSCHIDTTIYVIPLMFSEQKLDQVVLKKMGITSRDANLDPWRSMIERFNARKGKVRIGIVGQFTELHDAYKSVYEALFHAGLENGVEVEPVRINSADLEKAGGSDLGLPLDGLPLDGSPSLDGVLVPDGFGPEGVEGMVHAAAWARANKVPYFGICLGMQIMAIEWCRAVLGWADANSAEFDGNSPHPVVVQSAMRLGAGESAAEPGTHVFAAYGKEQLLERHRHSYELSNKYRDDMAGSGLKIAALALDGNFVDCVEWPAHPWGVGVQFHPEFKSRPTAAAPLFRDFIAAAKQMRNEE